MDTIKGHNFTLICVGEEFPLFDNTDYSFDWSRLELVEGVWIWVINLIDISKEEAASYRRVKKIYYKEIDKAPVFMLEFLNGLRFEAVFNSTIVDRDYIDEALDLSEGIRNSFQVFILDKGIVKRMHLLGVSHTIMGAFHGCILNNLSGGFEYKGLQEMDYTRNNPDFVQEFKS